MLKYKHDNRIFYIGKSLDLSVRLRDHYNRSSLGSNRLGATPLIFKNGRLV